MKIGFNTLYQSGVDGLLNTQQRLNWLQQQIASTKKLNTPSDDPTGAARVLDLNQSLGLNDTYKANQLDATQRLGAVDSILNSYTSSLQQARQLVVQSNNSSLSVSDRKTIATQLRSVASTLMSLGNTKDENGGYLFSGYDTAAAAFTRNGNQITFNGDQGVRTISIAPGTDIKTSYSGSELFVAIPTGKEHLDVAAGETNTGAGQISSSNVNNQSAWDATTNPGNFSVKFHVATDAANNKSYTYDVIDVTNNLSLVTGATPVAGPYSKTWTAGDTIKIAGINGLGATVDYGVDIAVTGVPATGDTFTLTRSKNKSIFDTLDVIATRLENAAGSDVGRAQVANSTYSGLRNIDNALSQVLSKRTELGGSLTRIQQFKGISDSADVFLKSLKSGIEDLDYTTAITDQAKLQVALEAAQRTFARVMNLSLFNSM